MALGEPLLLCGLLLLPHATLNSEQANGLKGHLPSEYLRTLLRAWPRLNRDMCNQRELLGSSAHINSTLLVLEALSCQLCPKPLGLLPAFSSLLAPASSALFVRFQTLTRAT